MAAASGAREKKELIMVKPQVARRMGTPMAAESVRSAG